MKLLHDEIIGEIVRKNGGWEVGVMQKTYTSWSANYVENDATTKDLCPGTLFLTCNRWVSRTTSLCHLTVSSCLSKV